MLASSLMVLLALVPLDGPAVARPSGAPCQTGVQHVALQAAATSEGATICISPGQATTLNFDSDFVRESLTLERQEHFAKVHLSESTVKLVPSEKLVPGETLKLTVRFKGDDAPAGAALHLVVHAVQAATHVEVHREKRTVEACERELREMEAALQQCRVDNEQLRAERRGPGGLTALLDSRVIKSGGVASQDITRSVTGHPSDALETSIVESYRSALRVAVVLTLLNPAGAPLWKPENATLTLQGKRGVELKVLSVWPSQRIDPGLLGQKMVIVEAEAAPDVATGTFTLKLWDASGARTVTLGGISFPETGG